MRTCDIRYPVTKRSWRVEAAQHLGSAQISGKLCDISQLAYQTFSVLATEFKSTNTTRSRGGSFSILCLMNSATTASTPLRRLAFHSTATCSAQASVYGKCILATYTDVRKDACKAEFEKFGACLREAVSIRWLCHTRGYRREFTAETQVVVQPKRQ